MLFLVLLMYGYLLLCILLWQYGRNDCHANKAKLNWIELRERERGTETERERQTERESERERQRERGGSVRHTHRHVHTDVGKHTRVSTRTHTHTPEQTFVHDCEVRCKVRLFRCLWHWWSSEPTDCRRTFHYLFVALGFRKWTNYQLIVFVFHVSVFVYMSVLYVLCVPNVFEDNKCS